ncbi:HTH-type transcriptional regulator LeuO [compost metagenome]
MHSDLRRLDLNLLVLFDVLYRNNSVLAASAEVGLSPSAFSHAIGRLRDALSDELFVRHGNLMRPTAYADEIANGVEAALRILSIQLAGVRSFDPRSSTATFTFAATDFTAFAVIPAFVEYLEKHAPGVQLKVVYSSNDQALTDLAAGKINFALGFSDEGDAGFDGVASFDLFSDEYVVAVREGHSRIKDKLSLDEYMAERHAVVLPWSDSVSVIGNTLAMRGVSRDVAVELPSLLAAPFIVAKSELLLTLPRRAAEQLRSAASFRLFELPFDLPRYTLKVLFHERFAGTSGHRWIMTQLKSLEF